MKTNKWTFSAFVILISLFSSCVSDEDCQRENRTLSSQNGLLAEENNRLEEEISKLPQAIIDSLNRKKQELQKSEDSLFAKLDLNGIALSSGDSILITKMGVNQMISNYKASGISSVSDVTYYVQTLLYPDYNTGDIIAKQLENSPRLLRNLFNVNKPVIEKIATTFGIKEMLADDAQKLLPFVKEELPKEHVAIFKDYFTKHGKDWSFAYDSEDWNAMEKAIGSDKFGPYGQYYKDWLSVQRRKTNGGKELLTELTEICEWFVALGNKPRT